MNQLKNFIETERDQKMKQIASYFKRYESISEYSQKEGKYQEEEEEKDNDLESNRKREWRALEEKVSQMNRFKIEMDPKKN